VQIGVGWLPIAEGIAGVPPGVHGSTRSEYHSGVTIAPARQPQSVEQRDLVVGTAIEVGRRRHIELQRYHTVISRNSFMINFAFGKSKLFLAEPKCGSSSVPLG
jgi:hypothetical protein